MDKIHIGIFKQRQSKKILSLRDDNLFILNIGLSSKLIQ